MSVRTWRLLKKMFVPYRTRLAPITCTLLAIVAHMGVGVVSIACALLTPHFAEGARGLLDRSSS